MFGLMVYLLFAEDGSNSSENKAFLTTSGSVVKIFLIIGSNEL